MGQIFSDICNSIFDDIFSACCQLILCFCTAVCIAVLLIYVLLWNWYHHQIDPEGRARDSEFWVVLIFIIFPAFAGAVFFLAASILLLVQRPNTLGGGTSWQDAAYIFWLLSAAIFTVIDWVWNQEWFTWPPTLVLWLLCITTLLWLPYFLFSWYMLTNVTKWEGVKGEIAGDELEHLKMQVAETVQPYRSKYFFSISVEKAFRLSSPPLEEKFDAFCASHQARGKLSNRRQLFHGTLRSAAKSIIESGFRLPSRKGMFGKGVYFADTPLKSMQYTRARTGTILLCEVELGNSMVKAAPASHLEAKGPDMQRSWVMKNLFRQQSFDSVTARAGFFGAVRVPEYVIYNPDQAVPRYLIFFRQRRKN